jgi:hypothetical protein
VTDLHHTLEAAAALAASGLRWLCGAPCAGARCDDAAQCFARQMALPGEPPRPVRLYLDDVRDPPGEGWTIARTAEQARAIMLAGPVAFASLDHDLGICERCTPGSLSAGGIMVIASLDGACAGRCSCACHETGYDFALWMAETGRWPAEKPVCHSANPVGRERIDGVIARYYQRPAHHAASVTGEGEEIV